MIQNLIDDTRFPLSEPSSKKLQINNITSPTNQNNAVSPAIKLLLTLSFYATEFLLNEVADFVGVSKTTTCVLVKEVTEAIATLRPI